MYRKLYEIIGFAYEADLHCISCATQRFGESILESTHGVLDNEGTEITPIFLGDEFDYDPYCGDCHDPLDT